MYLQCPPHCVYHVASYAFLDHHIGLGLAMYIPSRWYSFLGGRNSSIYNLYLQIRIFHKPSSYWGTPSLTPHMFVSKILPLL